ncbi:MAG: tRNA pseudouridine synthase B [Sulfobacillus sp.]
MSDGFVVLWKPPGPTSHDLVALSRRRLGVRCGHLGTLDPLASGVLAVAVGRGRRLIQYLVGLDKSYWSEIWFGLSTATGDLAGDLTAQAPATDLSERQVTDGISGLVGTHSQRVPLASAVKVAGKPLYERFRKGEQVVAPLRPVTVHHARLLAFMPGPVARAAVLWEVSSGTYIRTLAEELGAACALPSTLASLVRLRVGPFGDEQAISLGELDPASVLPLAYPFSTWPSWTVDGPTARRIQQGQQVPVDPTVPAGLSVAIAEASGQLWAIGRREAAHWRALTVVGE